MSSMSSLGTGKKSRLKEKNNTLPSMGLLKQISRHFLCSQVEENKIRYGYVGKKFYNESLNRVGIERTRVPDRIKLYDALVMITKINIR